MRSFEKTKEQLAQRLVMIEKRHDKVDRDLQRPLEADSQEQAQQAENDEVLEGLEAQGREEMEQIRSALARIDSGGYGTCTSCGEDIPDGRLEALPYTAVCIGCAD